jgi:hypothetical protein
MEEAFQSRVNTETQRKSKQIVRVRAKKETIDDQF